MVGSPTSFGVFCTCPRHFVSCIGHLSAGQTLRGAGSTGHEQWSCDPDEGGGVQLHDVRWQRAVRSCIFLCTVFLTYQGCSRPTECILPTWADAK